MLLGGMALSNMNAKAATDEVEFAPLPQTSRTIYDWYRYSVSINSGATATILGPDGNNGWFSTSNSMTGLFPYMDDGTFIVSYAGATSGTKITVKLYSRREAKVVKSGTLSGTSGSITFKDYKKGGDDYKVKIVNNSGKSIVIKKVYVETKN